MGFVPLNLLNGAVYFDADAFDSCSFTIHGIRKEGKLVYTVY